MLAASIIAATTPTATTTYKVAMATVTTGRFSHCGQLAATMQNLVAHAAGEISSAGMTPAPSARRPCEPMANILAAMMFSNLTC